MERATLTPPPQPVFGSTVGAKLEGLAPEPDAQLSISQSVFDALPEVLKSFCQYLAPGHERDLVLTGALVVCSGILSHVLFPHRDRWYHLNLYALVTADTGSGKGDAAMAWRLAEKIEARLLETSMRRHEEWKQQNEAIESVKLRNKEHKKKKEPLEAVPEETPEPMIRTLSIAANSSARGFLDRRIANGSSGIVFDTETKTLNIAKQQEWGETEAYLKGFHNDLITIDRKGGIPIRLKDPCFAAFMTGTPSATATLIPSVEDGLFGRFIHYWFSAPTVWRSQRPSAKGTARDNALADAACTLDLLHRSLEERDEALFVFLSDHHWDAIDSAFAAVTNTMCANRSDLLLHASVRRAALIAARIACIFATLRSFETDALDARKSIRCHDEDVQCAVTLATTYLAHAIALAKMLRKPTTANLSPNAIRVLHLLPEDGTGTITTKEMADVLGVTLRTVQRYLAELPSELLVGSNKGPYARVPLSHMSHVASVVSDALPDSPANSLESETTDTSQTTEATRDISENEYGNGELGF